ncbi:ATP-binding protein [Embleya sp. NBC_00888]|uniref:ATP-binding protein n=1 Tax=Embleya sp. NBC_00888 TaxID=2975960 RepID=UPI003865E965|nr:ATP-binding protein [Embleya sp. NBC_00888]
MATSPLVNRIDLPSGPQAAPIAREFITRSFADREAVEVRELLRLAASELVGNAVRHAGGARSISCSAVGGAIVVEVEDGGGPFALAVEPPGDGEACSGRGLFLVWALGCGLGSGPVRGGGKWVRAEVVTELPAQAPALGRPFVVARL